MGADKKLLLEVAERIGIDDEIKMLTALGAIARDWKALARNVDGVDSALALVTAIAEGTKAKAVAEAFEDLGAEPHLATLQAAGARLTELLDRIPEPMRLLLRPVGAFDERTGAKDQGLVEWPLLDKTFATPGTETADKPSYALSLGASAALAVEAGAKWDYSDVVPGPLLRLRAKGSLKPEASAKLPFSGGSISASASASAACTIEYYFAIPDPDTPYALAVGQRLGDLVDPFDFDAVWAGFTRRGLMGLHYAFDGSAAVEVSVSLADAGALAADIQAEIGATIAVNFDLEGHYFLTFRARADGRPGIEAVLSRAKKERLGQSIKFGGTIDLTKLAAKVHKLLAKALAKWDSVLQEITPYLSPGTLLRKEAGEQIDALAAELVKNKDVSAALARDLRGIVSADEPGESALAGWLSERLDGALDAAGGWADDQAAAADRLLDALGRSLPALAEKEVRKKLGDAALTLVKQAGDKLRAKVDDLFAAKAKELDKALAKLNAVADKNLDGADAAFARVRKLVGRYDALFHEVLKETENAARAKISIAVQIEETRTRSEAVEIEGSFLSNDDEARNAFHALTRGDFTALLGVDRGSGFLLDRERSSLTRYAGSSSKFGTDIVLFGFGASASEILSGKAKVRVDGTGAVQVDAEGRLEKRFSGADAEREIELVSSYSLVRARALAKAPDAAEASMGLAVTVGHNDKALERHEMERFVDSLVTGGLVAKSATSRAQEVFNAWAGSAGKKAKLTANLQLKFALDRKSIRQMLLIDDGKESLNDRQRESVVQSAFEALAESPEWKLKIAEATEFLKQSEPQRSREYWLMAPGRTRRALEQKDFGNSVKYIPKAYQPFSIAILHAHGMLDMVERLRTIYFSPPETQPDGNPDTWSPADYRDAERKAVGAVRNWLQLNAVLFWTNSEVHPRTIAFLQAIAALAKVEPLGAVSLTMWRKDAEDQPETVVLSHAPPLA